jgi:hypothetical protein
MGAIVLVDLAVVMAVMVAAEIVGGGITIIAVAVMVSVVSHSGFSSVWFDLLDGLLTSAVRC